MGNILPYYSPAMTGGGVSDNFMADMMAQMGGGMPGVGGPTLPAVEDKPPKKEKKPKQKIIRA
jgi:signal recognition particle subunit SRP19